MAADVTIDPAMIAVADPAHRRDLDHAADRVLATA
jgi:hypothetical protein